MDRGRIVFQGTPDELMACADGQAAGDTPLERGYTAALTQPIMTAVTGSTRLMAGQLSNERNFDAAHAAP